jgi:iron(III) transport system permease protein
LPLAILCALWAVIFCSREIAVTDLYQIGTLAEQIYLGYSLGQVNSLATNWSAEEIQAAGSIGFSLRTIQFLFLVAVSCAFFGTLAGFSKDSSSTISAFGGGGPHSDSSKIVGHTIGAVVVLLLLVGVPLFNLIYQGGTNVSSIDGRPTQLWAFDNLWRAIVKSASDFQNAFQWSALIAMVSSSLIIATSTLICFSAKGNRVAWWSLILLTAFFAALSGPDIGSGLTAFFAQTQNPALLWFYDCTIGPAVIANLAFCWPIATLVVWFAISQTTNDQIENAQLDRIGRWHRMFEFGFRQHWQLFLGVWLLVAAICFSELSASQLVLPPGIETVPQVTLGKLHAGVNETTAALSLLTIGLVVAIAMTAWIIIKRGTRLGRLG